MKLRKKIQKSMLVVIAATLFIAYAMTIFVLYRQNVNLMQSEIAQEAAYIKASVEISGTAYLDDMDHVQENTRVTLIDQEGNVLYDSAQDEVTFENHKNRPEIQEAVKYGEGADIRKSDTLGRQMVYHAVRMEDGTVLRVAKLVSTAIYTAFILLPIMILIALAMIIFAFVLSRILIRRLIRPINELDLDNPLENDTYEELTPLLESIDRQNKEKDAVANMRKEFSANVSHELKTPLTSISGYAEIMKNGLVRSEDMPVFAERIYNEASRLIKLVQDIIRLSRLDESAIEIEKEEVELLALTHEIVSRLAPQSAKKQVYVAVTGEKMYVTGVRQVLDEMLYNICENAIKYNKDGGSVTIWVGETFNGKQIIIQDTGIGIPEEHIDRIFERFYRVDKSHSKETGGTGLGLSIVKHAAILHGAQIHVKSEVGKGTRMEIRF